jgi:uncharacterized protein YjbI with pentapeptide repeats
VVAVVAGFVALAYWRRWDWTGLPAAHAVGEDGAVQRPAKTLWDWLQLLGIPVVLATLAFLLNEAQSSREQQHEDQRAARQRTTAADAERESTLRTYLAQMSDLVLDRQLLRSNLGADVRNVARTATLTAVRRLDGPRQGLVVQFLVEAGLLHRAKWGNYTPAVDVALADLSGAYLRRTSLGPADLSRADLSGADLFEAYLARAYLNETNLSTADLNRANLFGADLRGAELSRADLRGTNLSRANLSGADLREANLREANLRGANLRGVVVDGADFRGARGVDLKSAKDKPPAYGP